MTEYGVLRFYLYKSCQRWIGNRPDIPDEPNVNVWPFCPSLAGPIAVFGIPDDIFPHSLDRIQVPLLPPYPPRLCSALRH